MVLAQIQAELAAIYATPVAYDVRDFLITDPEVAAALTPAPASTGNSERLLVRHDEDDLRVSLFIDDAILAQLAVDDPTAWLHDGNLAAFLVALEGVSHLNCVLWHGERATRVTLFELELQAEIDKYVACTKLFSTQQRGIPSALHHVLFENPRYDPALDDDVRERYVDANYYAAKYCHGLRRRFPGHHDERGFLSELRTFYRLTRNEKVRRIRATH
ncbi:MAG: hypothetical protein AB7O21_03415 [Gammaproteobacteria bacterium]